MPRAAVGTGPLEDHRADHRMPLRLFSVSFQFFKNMNHDAKPLTGRRDWLQFENKKQNSIPRCLIDLSGRRKREAPAALGACSLCGETAAVYGFGGSGDGDEGTKRVTCCQTKREG